MDSKRKANGSAAAEPDDRSSKRRKLAEFDLSKGESRDSTTAYGLSFLEQIRRTQDKSGRLVATYFEKLLPREGNQDYYKQTRMPISLETIEEKLNKGDFKTLAELESYFKRMISNAKEFYPRNSTVFEDAERVRKALSNYMTKTNPAYGTRGYQAQPTPLPPEDGEGEGEEDEEEDDAEGNDDKQGSAEAQDEDAEGEEDEQQEQQAEQEESVGRGSRRRSIVLKRRESARPSRTSTSQARDSPRQSVPPSRPDHQYDGVPYKGLGFQQAQEKIVEELLRYNEPEYDAYFEPFHNLPPRALKDYYRAVTDPLSLKKLQKMVRGVHGRKDATGLSDFKSWGAFEEKSKLLWTNAYFYNEEGSEIYDLAQELEKAFYEQLNKAQAVVQEPTQPKIKLKVGQPAEAPSSSKKITIHVGGRGESADSSAPQTAQSTDSPAGGANGGTRTSSRLDAARSISASAPSPSPSTQAGLKAEETVRISPAVPLQPTPGGTPAGVRPLMPAILPQPQPQPQPHLQPQPHPHPHPHPHPYPLPQPQFQHHPHPHVYSHAQPVQADPLINGHVDQRRLRRAGKGTGDALIARLRIQLHPNIQAEQQNALTVVPHPREMQQSATVSLAPHHNRAFIVLMLPDFLYERQYSLWVLIDKQPLKPCVHPLPNQLPQERAFEVVMHPGVNVIEAHLIAAIPRGEREQGGPEVELEVITVFANVMRAY